MHSVVKSVANVNVTLLWEGFTQLIHLLVIKAINLMKEII